LYGAEIIRRQSRGMAEDGFFITVRNAGAALVLLFFLLPTFTTDFKTIRYCVRVITEGALMTPETFRSTRLDDFRLHSGGSRKMEMRDFMETVDEGMQLLRRHIGPQTRVTVFLVSNPYSIALGLPPVEGGLIDWTPYEMARRSHPPLQRLLGNAAYVLADRGCEEIKDVYGAEWDAAHLQIVEETRDFTLLKVPE
jgi:hypothetical protein